MIFQRLTGRIIADKQDFVIYEILDPELKVPFAVFLEELNTKLFTESGEIKLNTGNVTVSSAVPVRGIPFRVICFLG
jgi:exonuclease V gamma subunit